MNTYWGYSKTSGIIVQVMRQLFAKGVIESGTMVHSSKQLLFATILLYAVLWFVPDKKIAILVLLTFSGYLWYLCRSIQSVFALLLLAVTPLILGKQFQIDLVSASQLNIPYRPFGIGVDIIVGIREILSVGMFFFLIGKQLREKKGFFPNDRLGQILLLVPIAIGISTLLGSILPHISIAHALFFFEPYIFYQFFRNYPSNSSYEDLLAVITGTLLVESVITILQVIHGGPFGTVLEYFPDFVPVDLASDVGFFAFRFGGTFPYANSLAHYLLFMIFVLLPSVFDQRSTLREEALTATAVSLIAFIMTLSRSAWIAFGVSILVFFFIAQKRLHASLSLPKRITRFTLIGGIVALILAGVVILPRLAWTAFSFGEYGSITTRGLLLKEASRTFFQYPLFGVGLEVWVYYMYLNSQNFSTGLNVFRYFPEPVHNGFIKLLVETGIVGIIPYIAVTFLIFRKLLSFVRKEVGLYGVGLFAAFLAVVLNAQMQPILPDLSLLMILIALYENTQTRGRIATNLYGKQY